MQKITNVQQMQKRMKKEMSVVVLAIALDPNLA